jgi:hypothetical protein
MTNTGGDRQRRRRINWITAQRRKQDGGFVYAVRCTATEHVKIGFSHHPVRRVKQGQHYAPALLELVAMAPGQWIDEARWHAFLAPDQVHGEWFLPTMRTLDVVWRLAEGEQLHADRRAGITS